MWCGSGGRLHTENDTHTLMRWAEHQGCSDNSDRAYSCFNESKETQRYNNIRVYLAREAQLVEQSIEAALVVSSSLISSKLSSSYFSVCHTGFFLTAASPLYEKSVSRRSGLTSAALPQ